MDKDRTNKIDNKNTTDKEKTRARKTALVLLTDMDRTEMQLLEKLRKAGFSEEVVRDAVEYVRGFGYINDER
ncbi:MAG: regulatory protein RecX, partial [Lachnospiraceae bacterium]|nr:regulatory protein RecX [Lachnospiraceae bacterium]